MWNLQAMCIGLENVVGPEAVNRNEQQRTPEAHEDARINQRMKRMRRLMAAMITPGTGWGRRNNGIQQERQLRSMGAG